MRLLGFEKVLVNERKRHENIQTLAAKSAAGAQKRLAAVVPWQPFLKLGTTQTCEEGVEDLVHVVLEYELLHLQTELGREFHERECLLRWFRRICGGRVGGRDADRESAVYLRESRYQENLSYLLLSVRRVQWRSLRNALGARLSVRRTCLAIGIVRLVMVAAALSSLSDSR